MEANGTLKDSFPKLNRDIPQTASISTIRANAQIFMELEQRLYFSLTMRLTNIRSGSGETPDSSKIAIMFSGGVDCTVLARLSHEILPTNQPIDLLNVAVENPRVIAAANKQHASGGKSVPSITSPYESCPDRLTGLASYAELLATCKTRQWQFVAINVPFEEVQAHREQVKVLMHPHDTEMDLSISLALYFAARGCGVVGGSDGEVPYTSPARVLISGLGADELFGGYTRHATAFARTGHYGLLNELELDFNRLPKRNLGRDDRVLSYWSREVRYPYLDEDLVHWALQRPVWEKCGFGPSPLMTDDGSSLEPGKLILRLLALRLGMGNAAREKKRAIQFGARTAKMISGKTRGEETII